MPRDKEVKTGFLYQDLKRAGFHVQYNCNGDLLVGLRHRVISTSEIRKALYDAAYDDCQFSARPLAQSSYVLVEAL